MPDLDKLKADYPGWRFLTSFVQSNPGPGLGTILAVRKSDGVLVGGLTAREVAEKIIREDEECS